MSDHSLTISFANQKSVSDEYWLRLELYEADDNQMTVGEAADIIDELYHTSICGETETPVRTPDATDWDRALDLVTFRYCDDKRTEIDNNDNGYSTQIKVWRSHPKELYKLQMSNGFAGAARRVEDDAKLVLTIEDQSSYALDMPVLGGFRAYWTDIDGPDIHRTGNTIYWDGNVTGTLRVTFNTEFDLVNIDVTGKAEDSSIIDGTDSTWLGEGWYSGDEDGSDLTDVQDITCSVLAFYHYQYEILVLHKPEDDESIDQTTKDAICAYASSTHVIDDDPLGIGDWGIAACKAACYGDADCIKQCEKICFKRVTYSEVCQCGGDLNGDFTVNEQVPCPNGYNEGSTVGDTEDGGAKYVDCGGCDYVRDAGFYENVCCHPVEDGFGLPCCKEKHSEFLGEQLDQIDKDQILSAHPPGSSIVVVGPAASVCGELTTEQDVPNECDDCEGVEPLLWDYDTSTSVITPGSSGIIAVTGGKMPISVSLRGAGFWLDAGHSIRDGVTYGLGFKIYADDDACGSCSVDITDGCSSVENSIRSTAGSWGPDIQGTAVSEVKAILYEGGSYPVYYGVSGRYRQFERRKSMGGCGSSGYCPGAGCPPKDPWGSICYASCGPETPLPPDESTAYGPAVCMDSPCFALDSTGLKGQWNSPICEASCHDCTSWKPCPGLLAADAGYGSSCGFNGSISTWYNEWLC